MPSSHYYPVDKKVVKEYLVTAPFLVCSGLASSRRQDNADNEAIEGKCFSEDENENHSNKKFWLLCIGSAKQTHLLKGGTN